MFPAESFSRTIWLEKNIFRVETVCRKFSFIQMRLFSVDFWCFYRISLSLKISLNFAHEAMIWSWCQKCNVFPPCQVSTSTLSCFLATSLTFLSNRSHSVCLGLTFCLCLFSLGIFMTCRCCHSPCFQLQSFMFSLFLCSVMLVLIRFFWTLVHFLVELFLFGHLFWCCAFGRSFALGFLHLDSCRMKEDDKKKAQLTTSTFSGLQLLTGFWPGSDLVLFGCGVEPGVVGLGCDVFTDSGFHNFLIIISNQISRADLKHHNSESVT